MSFYGKSPVVDLYSEGLCSEADDPETLGHAPGVKWTSGAKTVNLQSVVDRLYQVYQQ